MQWKFDEALKALLDGDVLSGGSRLPVVVAVSGGVDSMVMATLCRDSALPLSPIVAHCNFHLRGAESDADEAFVRDWADRSGIPVHVAGFDTAGYAASRKVSIEMAARELRYGWFSSLCAETGSRYVFVAHNADDNAETIVLNLVRGTGLRGLAGMREMSELSGGGPVLLRPMLRFTRKQIEAFARHRGIEWREDSTNAESQYKRNCIRNKVFPILKTLNPSLVATLNREAGYFAQAEAMVEGMLDVEDMMTDSGDGIVRISLEKLMASGHWEYSLFTILDRYGFVSATVGAVERLLRREDGTLSGKMFESRSHVLYTGRWELIVCRREASTHFPEGGESSVTVSGPGEYVLGGRTVSISVCRRETVGELRSPRGLLYMDASVAAFPFVLRPWKSGDWLVPFGMKGRKKVSDLFADLKYDVLCKSQALMLARSEEGGRVLAVVGERIDDSVKVTGATGQILVIRG